MSWFRKDKPSNEHKTPASHDNHKNNPIKTAIEMMRHDRNPKTVQALTNAFYNCITNGEWVPMLCQDHGDKGFLLDYRMHNDKAYIAMFTDTSEVKKKTTGFEVVITDINKLLVPLFHNSNLSGIVIDPDTNALYLEKEWLLGVTFHSQNAPIRVPSAPPRDWGTGIPQYEVTDLMTDNEFLDFAMKTVVNYECGKNGFQRVSANNNPNVCPNLILEKNDEFYFVQVRGYCAGCEVDATPEEKQRLMKAAEKFGAKCCYADAGFGAADPDRFEAKLALRGDAFYVRYLGLSPLR